MADISEQIDEDIGKTISTKCIKGHKIQVPKEKIQTSSTGKSFVTLCPKCNGVARLKKDEVFELFGVNPRDHVAVGKLYESLAIGNTPAQGETSQNPPSTDDGSPDGSPVQVDDDDEDDDDIDEDDLDDEDDGDDDEEYTATIETVPDVTGKGKTVRRFRVEGYEDDGEEDDSDASDPRNRTSVKPQRKSTSPPSKKPRGRREEEGDNMENEEHPRRSAARSRDRVKPVIEDEVFDPNDILKDLIEEAGLDDQTLARIFDYIDMQPDGWQPAAIQGVLQMYLSPASATKISQRYQAELYKEEKRRERERQMLNLIGNPSGNMRLYDNQMQNSSPMNSPLRQQQGFGQFGGGSQFPPAQGFAPNGSSFPPDPYQPRGNPDFMIAPQRPPVRTGVSAYDVERMIDAKLDGVVDKLAKAMGDTKREDLLAQEAKEMRMMFMELLKTNMSSKGSEDPKTADPMLAQLMTNQATMLNTLMQDRLNSKPADPMENPIMKIMLQEVLSKKATSAPPLATTSEELSQRIQLQRLANELELAQGEFKDKQDGRAFTRDLAGQALSKIGESVASAWIETQRIQAEAAKEIASRQAMAPPAPRRIQSPTPIDRPELTQDSGEHPVVTEPNAMHKVRGIPSKDGTVTMPCPTCGSEMTAKIGDPTITCGRCGTTYKATSAPATHVDGKEPSESSKNEHQPEEKTVDIGSTGDYGERNQHSENDGSEMETRDDSTRDDWGTMTATHVTDRSNTVPTPLTGVISKTQKKTEAYKPDKNKPPSGKASKHIL